MVAAAQDRRRKLDQRQTLSVLGTQEIRLHEPSVLLAHQQQLVRADGPVRLALADETGLEVQERLVA